MIYRNPVVAEDGFVYEKEAIIEWLKTHSTSPITRAIISNKVTPLYFMKSNIKKYMRKHPFEKENQYERNTSYDENKDKIKAYMVAKKWEKLRKYTNYSFRSLLSTFTFTHNKSCLGLLLEECPESVMKHIIDNSVDIDKCLMMGEYYLIHYICEKSTRLEIIKLFVENDKKNINLEQENSNKWRPIHYALQNCSFEVIKYLIDKGADPESETKDKFRPIHFACNREEVQPVVSKGDACSFSTFETVKYLIDMKVDINPESETGARPIHGACVYSSLETIKYLVDNGADPEYETKFRMKPIQLACQHSTYETIKYLFSISKSKNRENIRNYIDLIGKNTKLEEADKIKLIDELTIIKAQYMPCLIM